MCFLGSKENELDFFKNIESQLNQKPLKVSRPIHQSFIKVSKNDAIYRIKSFFYSSFILYGV